MGGCNDARVLLQELDDSVDSKLDTAAKIHGVAASSDVLDTLGKDGTSEHGGRGGAVTGDLIGLVGNILDEPARMVEGSHVSVMALEEFE
ncbi:hypothetical protein BC938DRAFT_481794 [Jimgerdemannia flammicorona]|uniref:Uncharacterized protein n=1 Tax=Jimgerdemannia flammicorona TaxID=994334 RepID=A0A433QFC2_9FUNG|nr:hypothetical protein BC938DRAFT_481794 [Jimgerdemannia flammicorona]